MAESTVQNKPPRLFRMLVKAQNPFMKWLLRSPFHGIVSRSYMLLTFTGRKSGKVYSIPVQYAQEGRTLYVMSSRGYVWWKNLRGGAAVQIRLRGKDVRGRATTSTDPVTIRDVANTIYPGLSTERKEALLPATVAITIQLESD